MFAHRRAGGKKRELPILAAIGLAVLLHGAVPATATVPGAAGEIAFVAGSGTIYVAAADGSSVRRIVDGAAPAWSPDGRKLVFSESRPGPCAPCSYALVVLDIGSGRRDVVFEGTTFDPAPAWSPDGSRIAFVNQRQKSGDDEIWVVDRDGRNARQLTTTDDNFAPAWSPGGTEIAFYGFGPDGVHLYTINSNGTGLTQLTRGDGIDLRPTWAPDGSRIAFISDRGGSFELYVIGRDGTGLQALTSGGRASSCRTGGCTFPFANPSWSPDGTRIVFSSDREGRDRLYVVGAGGGALAQLPLQFDAIDPDWQPAVDVTLKLRAPGRVRLGRAARIRLSLVNTSPRTATGVHLRISGDRRLAIVSVSPIGATLAPGGAAYATIVVRARRLGSGLVRATVASAEADATSADNRVVARVRVFGKHRRPRE